MNDKQNNLKPKRNMQIKTKNGIDVTGLYIMALEKTITAEEFNNKIKEIESK